MPGEQNDLSNVVGTVRGLPLKGLHDGVGLAANGDGSQQVVRIEGLYRAEDDAPTLLPEVQQRIGRPDIVDELGVPVAIGLLAIAGEEVAKAGAHVACQVLDQYRHRVRFGIDQAVVIFGLELGEGPLGKALLAAEEVQGGVEVMAGSVCHAAVYPDKAR